MRHNPSTVVALAGPVPGGQPGDGLLAAVGRFMNVSLVRPDPADGDAGVAPAAGALRRAAGISSPYALVTADPLAAVAARWSALWEVPQAGAPGAEDAERAQEFELRAGEVLAAWRAGQFELPDYYLVLARERAAPPGGARPGVTGRPGTAGPAAGFYLGPLRALRPNRVVAVAASETAGQAAGILTALGSLRHGRWWPSLPDVIDAARRFYPGSLASDPDGPPVPLLP